MKATSTTISGRTQCARRRGRPVARVNGECVSSIASRRRRKSSRSFVSKPVPTSGKDEIAAFVIADEQRAEADARALRIGETAHHELLRRFAFHLQPVLRPAMFERRALTLGDDTFPALAPRLLPRRRIVEELHALHRWLKRQRLQEGAAFFERKLCDEPAAQPEDVEDVIAAPPVPRDLAIENHLVDRKGGNRARQPGSCCSKRLREYSWMPAARL